MMVSIFPLISSSHTIFLVFWTDRTAPSTVGIINFMFNNLFSFLANFYITLQVFTPALADGISLEFPWQQVLSSLHDSFQYSDSVVVWTTFARPPIFKSSSLCTKPLRIVLSAPTTVDITVTFMFHSFFSSSLSSKY